MNYFFYGKFYVCDIKVDNFGVSCYYNNSVKVYILDVDFVVLNDNFVIEMEICYCVNDLGCVEGNCWGVCNMKIGRC